MKGLFIGRMSDAMEREAISEHTAHQKRLKLVKSRIDTNAPKEMKHVKKNQKKKYKEMMSNVQVFERNQLLLERLQKVKGQVDSFKSSVGIKSGRIKQNIDELVKISTENQQILGKIQSVKSFYSTKELINQYSYNKTLSDNLSENARRVPKVSSYNTTDWLDFKKSQKTSRPSTGCYTRMSSSARPISAKNIKTEL